MLTLLSIKALIKCFLGNVKIGIVKQVIDLSNRGF